MYPRISDFINEVLGTSINLPIQSFGFMVAMAFIVAGYILNRELKRKGQAGLIPVEKKTITIGLAPKWSDFKWIAIGYFVAGWKIVGLLTSYDAFVANPQEYVFSMQGSWWAGLIVSASMVYFEYRKRKKAELPKPEVKTEDVPAEANTGNILMISIFMGLLGSKIFDSIERWDELIADPLGVIFAFSGLSFFGGLIFVIATLIYYCKKHDIKFLVLADSAAPALLIAYAIGRIGCQVAGDGCWGIENIAPKPEWLAFLPDWTWSYNYPHNVINEGVAIHSCAGDHCRVLANPVFPTPLYETIINLIWFAIIWSIRKSITTTGVLFGIYLIMTGISRFFIEYIRVNIRYDILGMELSQAQFIAIGLIVVGIGLIIYMKRRK